jgi:hypothetical protein
MGRRRTSPKQTFEETLKMNIALKMNRLPRLFCRVHFAHTTKQTPHQRMANAILWLNPPTTQSKKHLIEFC